MWHCINYADWNNHRSHWLCYHCHVICNCRTLVLYYQWPHDDKPFQQVSGQFVITVMSKGSYTAHHVRWHLLVSSVNTCNLRHLFIFCYIYMFIVIMLYICVCVCAVVFIRLICRYLQQYVALVCFGNWLHINYYKKVWSLVDSYKTMVHFVNSNLWLN